MIFIQFEAIPSQRVADRDNVSGASVNCWVNVDDASEAEHTAKQWIDEQGWVVVSVEECRTIDVAAEINGASGEYISGAVRSGGCLVFHKWPHSGESAIG